MFDKKWEKGEGGKGTVLNTVSWRTGKLLKAGWQERNSKIVKLSNQASKWKECHYEHEYCLYVFLSTKLPWVRKIRYLNVRVSHGSFLNWKSWLRTHIDEQAELHIREGMVENIDRYTGKQGIVFGGNCEGVFEDIQWDIGEGGKIYGSRGVHNAVGKDTRKDTTGRYCTAIIWFLILMFINHYFQSPLTPPILRTDYQYFHYFSVVNLPKTLFSIYLTCPLPKSLLLFPLYH